MKLDDLRDDLEVACLTAMRGDPAGPTLAGRLHRVCLETLASQGLRGARVHVVSSRGEGTRVSIELPQPGARVARVIVHLG